MTDDQLDEADLDALVAELNGLYGEFDGVAAENWAKRQEAEEPNPSNEGGLDGDDAEGREDEPGEARAEAAAEGGGDREYQAQLFLVIPHQQSTRKRPLDRRSQGGSPPLDSAGVAVTPQGSSTPTDTIKPGDQYTVECTVQNVGGIGASAMTVELFETHRRPDAVLDTTSQGVLELTYPRESSPDWDYSGFTTLSPSASVMTVFFSGSSLRWDNMLFAGRTSVLSDRTFRSGFGNKPRSYRITGRSYTSNTFTARLYDISGQSQSLPGVPTSEREAKRLVRELKSPRIGWLAEAPGRWVTGRSHNNRKEDLDLSSTVNGATMKAQKQGHVPANAQTTVSFSYTAPPARNGRSLTELHARAYSLSPPDTPGNWGALDHRSSRFVGRTELYWPVS